MTFLDCIRFSLWLSCLFYSPTLYAFVIRSTPDILCNYSGLLLGLWACHTMSISRQWKALRFFFGTIIIGIGFIVVLTPRSFVALSLSWAVRSLIAFTAFVWYLLMSIRSRTMQSCLWPWFGNVTANSSLLYCHFARLFSPAGDGVLTCPRSVFCFKRLIKSIFFPLIGKFSLSSFVVIP